MKSSAILEEVKLCRFCLEREGFRTSQKGKENSCDLCGGVLASMPSIAKKIREALDNYEYRTFLIGASIPQDILDREDELRSRYKIKGLESIKSQTTKLISKKLVSSTGKLIDYSRPDVTVLVSLSDSTISINSRSLWLSARYRKLKRGLQQRSSDCQVCNGLGCAQCNYLGKSQQSVQAILTTFFTNAFKADSCNFIWLGGEDENSLVSGNGRPFFVEVIRPKKRKIRFRKTGNVHTFLQSDNIELLELKYLEHKVTDVPAFEMQAVVHLDLKKGLEPLADERITELEREFSHATVSVRLSRRFKIVRRTIQSLSVRKTSDMERLDLLITCDGGIPLKKLVSGQENSVEPNLSRYLNSYEISQVEPFDILDVNPKPAASHSHAGRRAHASSREELGPAAEDSPSAEIEA